MRLLLDTHIFLWFITGDDRLSQHYRKTIEDADAVYLSVVSVWEVTVKYHLGKLPLPEVPNPWLLEQREQHGIESLALDERAVSRLSPATTRIRLIVCLCAKRSKSNSRWLRSIPSSRDIPRDC